MQCLAQAQLARSVVALRYRQPAMEQDVEVLDSSDGEEEDLLEIEESGASAVDFDQWIGPAVVDASKNVAAPSKGKRPISFLKAGEATADTADRLVDSADGPIPVAKELQARIPGEELPDEELDVSEGADRQTPAAKDTQGSGGVLPLANWMMSWSTKAGGPSKRSRTGGGAPSSEEVAQFAVEEELRCEKEKEQRQQDLSAAENSMRSEFLPLVTATEARVATALAVASGLESRLDASDDDIIILAAEFESIRAGAHAAMRACIGYSGTVQYHLLQTDAEACVREEASELLNRSKKAARSLLTAVGSVKKRKQEVEERRDQEAKNRLALETSEEQERIFKSYDKDGDGFFSLGEALVFIRKECNLELPLPRIEQIMKSEPFSASGIPAQHFAHFKLLVGIASVSGALEGVDAEIKRAEEIARPMSARGFAKMELRELPGAIENLASATEAARDYLAAARDQVQGFGAEKSQIPEAEQLKVQLEQLEARIVKAEEVSHTCKQRIGLHVRGVRDLMGREQVP